MNSPIVIYEDNDLIVVDKPSGWVVNDSSTTAQLPTIQKWLKESFSYELSGDYLRRSGIVHRLDKETSGILLVAKNSIVFDYLQEQFKKRLVHKVYLALLHGKLDMAEGTIRYAIGRLAWNRKRFGIVPGGREAHTDYKVLGYFYKDNEKFSYVEFYPKTGRTHQIRVHAKYIGHPIVSDSVYLGRKTLRKDLVWCPRLFLHAKAVDFSIGDKHFSFESKVPADLSHSLSNLIQSE